MTLAAGPVRPERPARPRRRWAWYPVAAATAFMVIGPAVPVGLTLWVKAVHHHQIREPAYHQPPPLPRRPPHARRPPAVY